MNQEFLSVLFQVIAAVGFAGIVLLLSVLFGKRAKHRAPADVPYECGVVPVGDGAPLFSVKFYMVAMLFVIFDIEVVFLYPWALNFKDMVMAHPESFVSMCIFLGVLLIAYLYALGKGA
ncbi:MAG: NADH-quinone oxidoreductase subunit A, partial [Akkermansia sp.]